MTVSSPKWTACTTILGASVALVAVALAPACGGSSNDTPVADAPAGDNSVSDVVVDSTPDSGAIEAAPEADNDATPDATPDTVVVVPTPDLPSKLVTAGSFQPLSSNGVTIDDYFIAFDSTGALVAIPMAAGSTPVVIDAKGAAVAVHGKAVFSWSGLSKTTNIGSLVVWTKAHGVQTLTSKSLGGFASASADGTLVVYSDAPTAKGDAYDVSIANSDGTGVHASVLKNLSAVSTCNSSFAFAGSLALIGSCPGKIIGGGDAGVDGGSDASSDASPDATTDASTDAASDAAGEAGTPTSTLSLSSIDATGATSLLASNLSAFPSISADGSKVLLVGSAGAVTVLALPSDASTPLDTGAMSGALLPDGTRAMYMGFDKSLKIATVGATPAPVSLSSGILGFQPPLTGETWSFTWTVQDPKNFTTDLILVPLAGGTPLTLATTSDSGIFGNWFTADHSLAIYYTSLVSGAGDMMVLDPTKAVSTAKKIASGTWVDYSPKGTIIVYDDNWKKGSFDGTADIRVVDAAGGTPKLVASQAEADFYLTHDKTKIVYEDLNPGVPAGLYIADIP